MNLFGNMFKSKEESQSQEMLQQTPTPVSGNKVKATNGIVLNLKKNDVVDLQLDKVHIGAGWDVAAKGRDYDLDLCAFLLDAQGKRVKSCNSCVYFANKHSQGIKLDKDNLTGEGDGDDENIYVTLSKLAPDVERVVFAVVIFNPSLKQSFAHVKNAKVRLTDMNQGDKEICRYNLTENGGDNTAVIFAELYKENNTWNFKAVGEYRKASIDSLKKEFK